jgi:hypothetical protein
MPTKARKCSAALPCARSGGAGGGSRGAGTLSSRQPGGGGPDAARTRCLRGRCGGGCPACGAIGAGGHGRNSCRRGAWPVAGDAGRATSGSVGSHVPAASGRDCRALTCGNKERQTSRAIRRVQSETGPQCQAPGCCASRSSQRTRRPPCRAWPRADTPPPSPGTKIRTIGDPASAAQSPHLASALARDTPTVYHQQTKKPGLRKWMSITAGRRETLYDGA